MGGRSKKWVPVTAFGDELGVGSGRRGRMAGVVGIEEILGIFGRWNQQNLLVMYVWVCMRERDSG